MSESAAELVPVAQYVRMSTENQRYSADNQAAAIELYAAAHGFEVVRTYADLGRSGLTLRNRPALQQLLADIQGGGVAFRAVLVYDVSRWGRFQDPDEAAACELACKQAGLTIHYCAEPFANDGSVGASILKTLKRVMAAEYSRELSEKTSAAQRRATSLGFLVGRWTPLGMRRLLVDHRGQPVRTLEAGEFNMRGCRVTLVPGPDHEVALVRRIFRLAGQHGWTRTRIAATLNKEGIPAPHGEVWSYQSVRNLLRCEAYIGNLVIGKMSHKLGCPPRRAPPSTWTRVEGAFEPIVSRRLFDKVQERLAQALPRGNDEMLRRLKVALAEHGHLDTRLLKSLPGLSSPDTYAERFGSLAAAFERVGYVPRDPYQIAALARVTQRRRDRLIDAIATRLRAAGHEVEISWRHGSVRIGADGVMDVRACGPSYYGRNRTRQWYYHSPRLVKSPLTLIARLDDHGEPVDYCLLTPASFCGRGDIYLPAKLQCQAGIDIFTSLDELYDRSVRLKAGCGRSDGRSPGAPDGGA